MPTELVVQQNRLCLAVVSDLPSSPQRAAGQVVCPRGTGWALELAGHGELGCPPVSHHPDQRASQAWQARQSRSISKAHEKPE